VLWCVVKIYTGHNNNCNIIENGMLYFNCHPCAKYNEPRNDHASHSVGISLQDEHGFLVISVNGTSPYFVQTKCDSLIKYIMRYAHENITVIVLADEIAHYNLQAFCRYKETRAKQEALKLGDQLFQLFTNSIAKYGDSTIKICKWNDLNFNLSNCIYKLEESPLISERVSKIATYFLNHRGQNLLNKSFDKKLQLAKKYVYSEIPILVCGMNYDNKWYRLLYYSGTTEHLKKFMCGEDGLHDLILDIKQKQEFADIKQMIITEMNMPDISIPGFIGIDIDLLH
jgi:hypothetical protein